MTYLQMTETSKAMTETTSFCCAGLTLVLTFGFWCMSTLAFDMHTVYNTSYQIWQAFKRRRLSYVLYKN